jgi:hypothetical protein
MERVIKDANTLQAKAVAVRMEAMRIRLEAQEEQPQCSIPEIVETRPETEPNGSRSGWRSSSPFRS